MSIAPVKPGGENVDTNGSDKRLTTAQRLKLFQGAAGIYFFFIQYGKLQEQIFRYRSPDGAAFNAVWFLQLLDALANMLVGAIGRMVSGSTPNLPQRLLFYSGLGQVMSKYCLSASLAAGLSFPIATLAKSAKMVPVMVGSLLFGGQTFSVRQISQASAIVAGTSLVTLAEGSSKSAQSSIAGMALVAAALACDGIVGGVQKSFKVECKEKQQKARPYDMMFWTNFYMALAALVAALAGNELKKGMAFCRRNPSVMRQILKLSVCGAMGQSCIFYTISNFDSVVCTAVTTTRKLASVLLSLSEGDKAGLSRLGLLGVAIAGAGITGEVL